MLLGTFGVIWGDLRTFWSDFTVILECRITVCYKTISQIRQRVLAVGPYTFSYTCRA